MTQELAPTEYARRSFLYRTLTDKGASFAVVNDAAIAESYSGSDEIKTMTRMGLCDLSPLPRTGYKGRVSLEWLRERNIQIGEEDNRAYRQEGGALVARLAPTEALILPDIGSVNDLCDKLDADWSSETANGSYQVPRASANYWFMLTGERSPNMFAKICGIDLRIHKFEPLQITQTSVARSNAIIIRDDVLGDVPAFHLLGDSASAVYILGCLIDAMNEFDGALVGYGTVRSHAKET